MEVYNTTKELILNTPVPVQTRTYKPVSHGQLIDLTLDGISKAGFILDKQTYSAAADGQIANGKFSISNVADSEMQLQIGWQNLVLYQFQNHCWCRRIRCRSNCVAMTYYQNCLI